jgi:hypothetical protein
MLKVFGVMELFPVAGVVEFNEFSGKEFYIGHFDFSDLGLNEYSENEGSLFMSLKKCIRFPFCGIIIDIIFYGLIFIVITDYMFVKTGLPNEITRYFSDFK